MYNYISKRHMPYTSRKHSIRQQKPKKQGLTCSLSEVEVSHVQFCQQQAQPDGYSLLHWLYVFKQGLQHGQRFRLLVLLYKQKSLQSARNHFVTDSCICSICSNKGSRTLSASACLVQRNKQAEALVVLACSAVQAKGPAISSRTICDSLLH